MLCPLPRTRARALFVVSVSAGLIALALSWAATQRASVGSNSQPALSNQRNVDYGKLPLSFEANQGQTDGRVKFLSRGPGYDLFLTATDAVISLRKPKPLGDSEQSANKETQPQRTSVLYLKMLGANPNAQVSGEEEQTGKINYFIGDDPHGWRTNIPTYQKVRYAEIFPGVDLVYYGNRSQLEYDFVLAPHTDPRTIKFRIDGAENLALDEAGNLRLSTVDGDVQLRAPVLYQLSENGRRQIKGGYVIKGREIGFKVEAFDRERALIIDPVLSYSTLIGTGGNEQGNSIAVDAQGNAYVTGNTTSASFPTTPGAFQTTAGSFGAAFVTKLDPAGTTLIYSTYLAGSQSSSFGNGIAVDPAGNAFVTGSTSAPDFPLLNPIRGGRNNLLISTNGGNNWNPNNIGTLNRPVNYLAIDKNASLTMFAATGNNGGLFKSTDGGANWTALNTGLANASSTVVVIDPTASNIIYAALNVSGTGTGVYKSTDGGTSWSLSSTGLGSSIITALAIDPQNPSTLFAGNTSTGMFKSTNGGTSWALSNTGITFSSFPSVIVDPTASNIVYAASNGGVYKTTNGGSNWAFVNTGLTTTSVRSLVMDPTAPGTLYAGTINGVFKTTNGASSWSSISTGLPASLTVNSLAVDPVSPATMYLGTLDGRIFKTTNGGGNWNVVYQTTTNTNVRALVIDQNATTKILAGVDSASANFTTPDVFVTKLNAAGSGLIFSTLLGGIGDDQGYGIAIDASGNSYIVGQTLSNDFPAVNAFQSTFAGPPSCTGDAFISKLNSTGSALTFSSFLGGAGCDYARSVAVDSSGNAYVTGSTGSSGLATPGAFDTTITDNADVFAVKVSSAGALSYFTYLGGESTDNGNGIAVDSAGNAYLTGLTVSFSYPTLNAIQSTNAGGVGDAFISKLNGTGTALIYSTFLGAAGNEGARCIALDSAGNVYVAGFTNSTDFPLVAGAIRNRSPLYKTTNGGGNWVNDNYGIKSNIVTAMAANPVSPAILFAGSRESVFKSTDSGRNWSASASGLTNPGVTAIVVDPATPSTIYLSSSTSSGTSQGVFKSTDNGNSWNPANNGLGNGGVNFIAIDPVTPATLYALTGGALFKSINGGGLWTKIGPFSFSAIRLVIDPLTPTTLYAAQNDSGGGILKSIDGGANWQPVNTGITTPFMNSLAIDPATPSTLYAGGNNGLFKTVNGGSSWTLINSGLGGPLAIDPVNPSTVYASSSSSGVFKSTNAGSTWASINNGLAIPFISSILINPLNTSTVYVGVNAFVPDEDGFVAKLSPQGTSLIYSTLIGGVKAANDSSNIGDEIYALAVDPAGNAYVTGITRSIDFPAGVNSYQPFNRGFTEAFISKLTMSYVISGQVLDGASAPVAGAEVVLSDGSTLSSVITESDGSYLFSRLIEGGNFTVSASKANFTMAPASQSFNNLNSNQTLNFVATPTAAPFFTISGQVTNNATPLNGVTVTLSGSQAGLRTTDSSGNYSFTLAGGGNYTVTPSMVGFTFSPANQSFNSLAANQTANFAATRQNFVVTNANDHGAGSLRQAITDANATPGLDTITFNIPGSGVQTINLLIGLPTISDPVVIDGTTQPGYAGTPLIELNGQQAGPNAFGLFITAGNSTVRGLAIGRFSNNPGITLNAGGGNVIQGNYLGIDPAGTSARANSVGIMVTNGSTNNLIGGSATSARNVISGNGGVGISLGGANNQVQGNFIGTNAAGSAAVSNTTGIDITGSPQFTSNLIGGTSAGAGNLISGNSNAGINMGPGNSVQGNLIGTDATGLKAIPNSAGINATNGGNNVIGGLAAGARNVISGNNGDGVNVGGAGSVLQGNFIGVDITGAVALGNGGSGVTTAFNGAVIGGNVAAARNIISANNGFGNISLSSSSSPSTVQGNYIGTDLTGTVALTNPKPGMSVQSSSHIIGGTTPETRNVICGNTVGIIIGGSTTAAVSGNTVQGNYIGVNASGTGALPNTSDGIQIFALNVPPVGNNIIGGVAAGAGNRIAFNSGNGVLVQSGTGNSIRGNSIVANGGLGIDLAPAGITSNDAGDADTGANNRQNVPTITSVTPGPNPPVIKGTLNSTASTSFQIDFYFGSSCDLSGVGEGEQYLGTATVVTGADGNGAIDFTATSAIPAGATVTGTATDPAGNTSEFSACAAAATNTISFSQAGYSVAEGGGAVTITVVRSGDTSTTSRVDYATSDGTASQVGCATASGLASSKCDFTTALGTLAFAAGETSKTFQVLISQDVYVEGAETFTVNLANPAIGSALGATPSAVVTINDDLVEPAQNPLDDARAFVIQHYHDFLNREPDQSGLDFWTNQITSCGTDPQCIEVRRIDVSASFFLSIEFQQSGYLVERFYRAAFGNATGTSTFGGSHQLSVPVVRFNEFLQDTQRIGRGVIVLQPGWEQLLENNKQAYAGEFVATSRFLTAFPTTMTPAQFVDKLNQNAGNVLSVSERTTAINLFGGAGNTLNVSARAQAVRMVAEDTDLYNAEYNRAFVLAQYFGYLRRNPNDPQDTDYTGFDFWLTKLNQFNGNYINAEMVKAFLSSIEYRQRFGP